MDLKKTGNGHLDIRSLLKRGTPLSEFRLGQTVFHLSDEEPGDDGGKNLPVCRDDVWQDMLRMVLGRVPEGAEHAPPCYCEMFPALEKYSFAGLAGLPPAVRLMDGFFPVRDQSKRGACFAFALVALCEYMLGKTVELSEQSLFHFTKLVTPGKIEDLGDGAIILDSIHAVEEYGICPLSEWHYNPESWNYVEDPYNEGQGKALQRKLEAAQPYRFRNWRTLSRGSVLQFKQAIFSQRPIYTGVLVTSEWDSDEVRATGRIPYPKLLWNIRILPPPRGVVLAMLAENGVEPDDESIDILTKSLMAATLQYVEEVVFKKKLSVLDSKESEDGVRIVVLVNDICGGHAMCLAGYVDDSSYPGGGYFIARNSWSDDKWAPDSPEMPGYALLPYAYVADFGHEGIVMSDFPEQGRLGTEQKASRFAGMPLSAMAGGVGQDGCGGFPGGVRPAWPPTSIQSSSPASCAIQSAFAPASASADAGFEAWLAARKSVLSRPARDAYGVLLRPGTQVLVPDPSQPSSILRDTPESRAKLRAEYEKGVAAMGNAALRDAVREIADEAFARQTLVLSMETIREELVAKGFDRATPKAIRSVLLEMQEKDSAMYAVCINQFGREEFRHASVVGERKRVTE